MKHSSGPWNTDGMDITKGDQVIATCDTKNNFDDYECEANACLIAASPEMLAALKNCLPYVGSEDRTQLEKLIAKAEGK